ncbi:hypothetical protein TNCV_4517801, partial [Trichonephila clavipes]
LFNVASNLRKKAQKGRTKSDREFQPCGTEEYLALMKGSGVCLYSIGTESCIGSFTSSSVWKRNALLSGKKQGSFQADKSGLYGGCSNTFQQNFFKVVWVSRNCSQHRFDFGDNFKLQKQLSGGSVVVVHEEPQPQMTGTLSYRPEEQAADSGRNRYTRQATGRPISRFTVARLHGGESVCTTPCTVCTFNACPSEKAFSVVPGTPELERQ